MTRGSFSKGSVQSLEDSIKPKNVTVIDLRGW